jgi:Uma2 family endonuclease
MSGPDALYPDSDGRPMAENTLQFEWIVTLKENLEILFRDRADVFVAGDLLWYAVEGEPAACQAPDVLVAFGRPKGYRGSYKQWEEGKIAPQVVFEVWSPGNRHGEMVRKHRFYEKYGVEEYYLWDPHHNWLDGWRREGTELVEVPEANGWVSPRLGVRFVLDESGLRLFGPDGKPFLTVAELDQVRREAERRAAEEKQRADQERERAEKESQRAERLAAQLRALGVEPEA